MPKSTCPSSPIATRVATSPSTTVSPMRASVVLAFNISRVD